MKQDVFKFEHVQIWTRSVSVYSWSKMKQDVFKFEHVLFQFTRGYVFDLLLEFQTDRTLTDIQTEGIWSASILLAQEYLCELMRWMDIFSGEWIYFQGRQLC